MALPSATNPETGETFVLVDNAWQPVEIATNPTTGETFGLVGNAWQSLGFAPKKEAVEQPTSFLDAAQNLGVSALKIGPTAVKGLAELGSMVTGDAIDLGVGKSMEEGMQAIDEVLGTDKFNAQQKAFAQLLADDTKSVGDLFEFLIANPAILVDQSVSSIGSMFLPVGAAGAAAKGAKALKASKAAVDKAMLATTIGTSAAQNAASTFAELEGASLEDRYAGAAVSAGVSLLAGYVAGGGAEAAVAKKMIGDLKSGKIGLDSVGRFLKATGKEALQETGEEVGGVAGELVGGETPTEEAIAKRLSLSAILGGVVGGGAHVATNLPTGAPTEETPPPAPSARAKLPETATPEQIAAADAADQTTQFLTQIGLPAEDAARLVSEELDRELRAQTKAIPADTEREARITSQMEDLVSNGYPPEQARQLAEEYVSEQDAAEEEAQSAEVAGEPVSAGTGVSPTVPVPAPAPVATGLAEAPERSGMVRAGETVGEDSGATSAEPVALEPTTPTPAPVETVTPTPVEPTTPAPTFAVDDQQYTDLVTRLRSSEDPLKPTIPLIQNAIGGKPQDARDVLARMEQDGVVEKRKNGSYKVIKPTEKPVAPEAPAVEEPAPAPEEPVAAEAPAVEEPVAPEAPTPAPVEEPVVAETPAVEGPIAPETPAPADVSEESATAKFEPLFSLLTDLLVRGKIDPVLTDVAEVLGVNNPKFEAFLLQELEARGVLGRSRNGKLQLAKEPTKEIAEQIAKARKYLDPQYMRKLKFDPATKKILRENAIAQLYSITQDWGGAAREAAMQTYGTAAITDVDRKRAKELYEAKKNILAKVGTPSTLKFLSVGQQTPETILQDRAELDAVDREMIAKSPSLTRLVNKLVKQRADGWINDAEFAAQIVELQTQLRDMQSEKELKDIKRGRLHIKARIASEVARGTIPESEAKLFEWFVDNSPHFAEGLGVSIRKLRDTEEVGMQGEYLRATEIITLIKGAVSDATIVHETLHHLERMMPTEVQDAIVAEWAKRLNARRKKAKTPEEHKLYEDILRFHYAPMSNTKRIDLYNSIMNLIFGSATRDKVPRDSYQFINASEFWAVNGSQIVQGRYDAVKGGVLAKLKNWLRSLSQRIRFAFGASSDTPLIRALDSLAKGDGEFVSKTMVRDRVIGKIGGGPDVMYASVGKRSLQQLDEDYQKARDAVKDSRDGETLRERTNALIALRNPSYFVDEFRRFWGALTTKNRTILAKNLTTDFIDAVTRKDIPELGNTLTLMQSLEGMQKQLLSGSAELVGTVYRAIKKDPSLGTKLADVALTATHMAYDPADPNNTAVQKDIIRDFAALGPDGQRVYTVLRDYYSNMNRYRHMLIMDQINALPVDSQSKAALQLKLRQMYEEGQQITPYFPLMRFGDYTVTVGQGANRKFYMCETIQERSRLAEALAQRLYPNLRGKEALARAKEDGVMRLNDTLDKARNEDGMFQDSKILPELFTLVDGMTLTTPHAKADLKDAMYQLYLHSLPEANVRKQFMHREGIPGFSTDILRNTVESSTRMASHLARLKYSVLLRNSLAQARDSIAERENLKPYVTEMNARVQDMLAPPERTYGQKLAHLLNRFTFLWTLTAPATAIVQPTSVLITGMPVLASRHGWANTTAEMSKSLRFWKSLGVTRKNLDGTLSYKAPSLENAKGLTPIQRKAVRDLLQRNAIQSTVLGEIYGYRSEPTADYGSPTYKAKQAFNFAFGGLLHSTERLTREYIAFTAFNLNYEKNLKDGMPQDEAYANAIDQTVLDVNESLSDPAEYNRPGIWKTAPGRVLLMLKLYPLYLLSYLTNNFVRMLPLLNKAGKKEAAHKFFGTLGMTFMFSGVAGLPFLIKGALGALWAELGDDDEMPEEMRDLGLDLWLQSVAIPETFGHVRIAGYDFGNWSDVVAKGIVNKLLGWDVASRTGAGDMLFRDPGESATSREGLLNTAVALGGPLPSLGLRFADAFDAFESGDTQRGIELIAPALVRNATTLYRYEKEGVKTPGGDVIDAKGNLTSWEKVGQAFGFRPADVAGIQDAAYKTNQNAKKKQNEWNVLLRRAKVGIKLEDREKLLGALVDMSEFVRRNPGYAESLANVPEALRQQQERAFESIAGVTITKKNVTWAWDVVSYYQKKQEERNQEAIKRAQESWQK